jgi:inosine-uridine nucleoside N-ribohydrolase
LNKELNLSPWILPAVISLVGLAAQDVSAEGQTSESRGLYNSQPVKVILDSDIGPDCDDAGAVAVLNALADKGEAHILAMMCCTGSEWGAPCLQAINTYYGRGNIPVGTLKVPPGFLDQEERLKFNRYVAQNFPCTLKSGRDAPDAVDLYREILAAQPDGSVVIAAIGPLSNLRNLLDSPPDDYSSLDGRSLVALKVRQLSVMGGAFPAGKEWNFEQDPEAAVAVTERWPTPILFSGFEIGITILTGESLYTQTPTENPVRKAYELYTNSGKRYSWDQTVVLFAVRGLADYWKIETGGRVIVENSGRNRWDDSVDQGHAYLKSRMPARHLANLIEELMIQPPSEATKSQ